MKPVTITYRPISFLPFYRTVNGNFPQNWGDVTPVQLVAIACLYKNRISDLLFMRRMMGLPLRALKRCGDYERFKLMEQFEFIADHRAYHDFIIRKITLGRLIPGHPELGSGPSLYAPDAKLKGVTFAQFIFADTYFGQYQATESDDDLNKFIAALYLRKREKFEEHWISRRYQAIGKIDRTTREAIAINYTLIREWLALAYPLIFQKRDEMSSEDSTDRARPVSESSPWIKIFQNFVGDDILHDDEWANKPINTILQFMTKKYKENAKRK